MLIKLLPRFLSKKFQIEFFFLPELLAGKFELKLKISLPPKDEAEHLELFNFSPIIAELSFLIQIEFKIVDETIFEVFLQICEEILITVVKCIQIHLR